MPTQSPGEYIAERDAVLAKLSTGRSRQDVAEELGISRSKVDRYFRSTKRIGATVSAAAPVVPPTTRPGDAPRPQPVVEPEHSAPPPIAPPLVAEASAPAPPTSDSDTLQVLIELQREQIRLMRESREVGNLSAAQKFGRDAAGLSNTIARMQKLGQDDADVLRISRAEIAAARLTFEEKVKALLDRPLLCAHCGRALSVEWGEGK